MLKVCLFRLGNPAGYVIHQQPTTVWRHILIGVGPFFVNTLGGFVLGVIAIPMHMDIDHLTPPQLLLLWLAVSIAMHSFPSTGDAKSIWYAVWSKRAPISARLIGAPLVAIIFSGAIGSIFWLDALYGIGVVGAAGAFEKAAPRSRAASSQQDRDERIVDEFLATHSDSSPIRVTAAATRPPSTPSFDQTIAKISREMNADLPRQLDKSTRIDTTIPGPGKLTYVYTMMNPANTSQRLSYRPKTSDVFRRMMAR